MLKDGAENSKQLSWTAGPAAGESLGQALARRRRLREELRRMAEEKPEQLAKVIGNWLQEEK